MRVPGLRAARFVTTLLLTNIALCAATSLGMVGATALPHAIERCASFPDLAGDTNRSASRIGECAVAIPCFLHSLTSLGQPIDSASQHMSSGFAVDEDWLRLIPTPVNSMAFNFFSDIRVSAVALAMGALVSGCGGGGSSDSESTQASAANASTADATGSVSTASVGTSTGASNVDLASSPAMTVDS